MRLIAGNLIFFLVFTSFCWSQSGLNDCSGAVQICGDGAISSNANGTGIQEISALNACSSEEHNSLWLKIEITKSGSLGFNLIPTSSNISIDYDFFIYGPNASCDNLGFAIRCSTTNPNAAGSMSNHTGMNDTATDTSEGPGPDGNNFVKSLDVQVGDTYFIVIDRPIGNSPFELEWTGTATQGGSPFPQGPEANKPEDLQLCNARGTADFNVSSTQNQITTQNGTTTTYHESLAEAVDNTNSITGNYTSTAPVKTLYARVENDLTGCAEIVDFDLIINPGPQIALEYTLEKCDLDFSGNEIFELSQAVPDILQNLNPANFEAAYFENLSDAENGINAISPDYLSAGGMAYIKLWEKGNPDCYNISEITLKLNIPPQLESYSVVQPIVNANTNTVTLNFPLDTDYEYSLGSIDGPYQESTTFENVNSGFQPLYIRDKKACAIIQTEVAVLGYDNFFTPNNDGIHDRWQIKGIAEAAGPQNQIYIFDRYGKLLKKMKASEDGWNGTFNGKPLPTDDYWFRVGLKNGVEFNGHFTLKR